MDANILRIHNEAIAAAEDVKSSEARMIDVLMRADQGKVFLALGHSSLFTYCTEALKLGEAQAYNYISIARKSVQVPELKQAVEEGRINPSNAKKITSVITPENKEKWLNLAENLPQNKLVEEIRKETKQDDSFDLKIRVNSKVDSKRKREEDLMSQKFRRHVSMEEAYEALLNDYLERHDPVEKAKRNAPAQKQAPIPAMKRGVRTAIPAALIHQVNLRDQGKCRAKKPDGNRCNGTRWPQIHHVVDVCAGGKHELSNLITLCSGHHRAIHMRRAG